MGRVHQIDHPELLLLGLPGHADPRRDDVGKVRRQMASGWIAGILRLVYNIDAPGGY